MPLCVESGVTGTSSRDDAEKQVNEFHEVRVMRWRGGWAARVPTPSFYTPLTPAPRIAAESYQSVAGGSVATRCRSQSRADQAADVCDAAKRSARRHLARFERFLRPLQPTGRIERGCACELVNVHMCEARAFERRFCACAFRSAFRENSKPLCVLVLVNRL